MNLRDEVRAVREKRATLTLEQLREAHETFAARYPKLFDMLVVEDEFEMDTLGFMLDRCAGGGSGTSRLDTDMTVAMHLADRYLFDDTNRPDAATIERCKAKLRRAADCVKNISAEGTEIKETEGEGEKERKRA